MTVDSNSNAPLTPTLEGYGNNQNPESITEVQAYKKENKENIVQENKFTSIAIPK